MPQHYRSRYQELPQTIPQSCRCGQVLRVMDTCADYIDQKIKCPKCGIVTLCIGITDDSRFDGLVTMDTPFSRGEYPAMLHGSDSIALDEFLSQGGEWIERDW